MTSTPPSLPELDAGVDIGHVHLKVSDLERSVAFYRDVLGLTVQGRMGDRAAFLSAGEEYHHHLGLNTFESLGGSPPPPGTTGLYHVAFRYPSRAALARALRRLQHFGVELSAANDHGLNEALYLNDPDGNGIELDWDRAPENWPRTPEGRLTAINDPLDVVGLLQELDDEPHRAP